ALVPDWAYVTFTATPSEVIATIDGETTEVTDKGIEVLSGEHELTLSAPGFMPVTVPLQIVAGIDQTLGAISLTPA
ncbi:MAG: PEGA domain-containing protein, partial [Halieaceae bacterium]